MRAWPVLQMAHAQSTTGKGVVRAVDSENLYTKIQEDAGTFPVFADSAVIRYAELYGQPRREEFQALLGMAEAYFPMIEKALAEQSLPEQLKFLPMALSGMNVLAGSNTGEAGLWMLTYPVAKRYGLQVTGDVDERRHAEKSTMVAVRYLKDLYAQYGTWPLATMAFACGPANVERARLHATGTSSYRTYYPHFDADHRDVLPSLMAFIHLTARAEELGIQPLHIDLGTATDMISADRMINFKALSAMMGIPLTQVVWLNQTLSNGRVPENTSFYLPAGMGTVYAQKLDLLSRAEKDRMNLALPPEGPLVEVDRTIHHTVHNGDNLGSIAKQYNVSVPQLRKWNGLQNDRIYAGKKLVVHVRTKVHAAPAQKGTEEPTNAMPSSTVLDRHAYTVQAGDSLYTIAQRYPGITAADLIRVNGISTVIHPGQRINIPASP